MNLFDKIKLVEQIDTLIRSKATGTPTQMAAKLEIPEIDLYKIIRMMKSMGGSIMYCSESKSFYYKDQDEFQLGLLSKAKSILGKRRALVGNLFYTSKNLKSLGLSWK